MNKIIIRNIDKADNHFIKNLVKEVLMEFEACGPGFASSDPELEDMFEAYNGNDKAFYVVELDNKIIGVGGFGPLVEENNRKVCELRKMYFTKESRGHGIGKKLIQHCILEAKKAGYDSMYLETLKTMKPAQKLYQSFGFEYIENRMGDTGHHGCPIFMLKEL